MTTDDSVPPKPELRPSVPPRHTQASEGPPAAQTPSTSPGPGPEKPAEPQGLFWRVSGGITVLKGLGAAGFLLAGLLLGRDATGLAVAITAAGVIGLYAVRDLLAPVRLAADGDGVTLVTGFASRRRIPWRDVERIRVDQRTRLGMRTELLEIDTGTSLHLFGRSELGAPVESVAEALRHVRTGR